MIGMLACAYPSDLGSSVVLKVLLGRTPGSTNIK